MYSHEDPARGLPGSPPALVCGRLIMALLCRACMKGFAGSCPAAVEAGLAGVPAAGIPGHPWSRFGGNPAVGGGGVAKGLFEEEADDATRA